MRELKFRAWRESDKTMYQDVTFDKIEVMWLDPDAIEDPIEAPDVRGCWVLIGDRAEHSLLPFVVLMQYTGVKDKNGREIYEGDIMRDTHGNHREEHQVYWAKSMGAWACDIGEEWGDMSGSYTWEVIGNIYENPGLLGENGSLGKT